MIVLIGSMISVKELQERFHIGKNQAYQLVNRPDFPKIKIGRKLMIPEEELSKWITRNAYCQ